MKAVLVRVDASRAADAEAAAPGAGAGVVRCSRCAHAVAADTWSQLRLERTLTVVDIEAHVDVSAWPDGVVVEVRSCTKCTSPIARNVRGGKLCGPSARR